MQVALLCYTRRVPIANLLRGVWMNALKNLVPRARAVREISRRAITITADLAALAGMAIAVSAQAPTAAPKKTIIRAGRVLNVRTGEMKTNQAIVIEGEKITRIAPSSEITAAAGDTT